MNGAYHKESKKPVLDDSTYEAFRKMNLEKFYNEVDGMDADMVLTLFDDRFPFTIARLKESENWHRSGAKGASTEKAEQLKTERESLQKKLEAVQKKWERCRWNYCQEWRTYRLGGKQRSKSSNKPKKSAKRVKTAKRSKSRKIRRQRK
jgi:hypothetical protein